MTQETIAIRAIISAGSYASTPRLTRIRRVLRLAFLGTTLSVTITALASLAGIF